MVRVSYMTPMFGDMEVIQCIETTLHQSQSFFDRTRCRPNGT